MAAARSREVCLFKDIYKCSGEKLIQSSRIDTILSASRVRGDNLRLRSELSDGPTVACHKNCVSKYVSPSAVASLGKHAHDEQTQDVSVKRLRSSTSASFEFRKHCLFCADVTECLLPNEYDSKVPHKYRISASLVTTDRMADGKTSYRQHLLGVCEKEMNLVK